MGSMSKEPRGLQRGQGEGVGLREGHGRVRVGLARGPAVLGDEGPEGCVREAAAALGDAGLLPGGGLQVLPRDVLLLIRDVPRNPQNLCNPGGFQYMMKNNGDGEGLLERAGGNLRPWRDAAALVLRCSEIGTQHIRGVA